MRKVLLFHVFGSLFCSLVIVLLSDLNRFEYGGGIPGLSVALLLHFVLTTSSKIRKMEISQ